jgi:hypothetical protein
MVLRVTGWLGELKMSDLLNSPTTPRRLGAYRRAIRIASAPGVVTAAMEDDVHHFRVTLQHDGTVLQNVTGEALRTPYSTCPGALGPLSTLAGLTLDEIVDMANAARFQQCMHLHDLAAVAARHAGREKLGDENFSREYRVEIDHDAALPLARLWCDGEALLQWSIDRGKVHGSPYDGVALKDLAAHLQGCAPDTVEAALILRRASLISFVRHVDLDAADASTLNPASPANCYAKQPERRAMSQRVRGSSHDFFTEQRWPLED